MVGTCKSELMTRYTLGKKQKKNHMPERTGEENSTKIALWAEESIEITSNFYLCIHFQHEPLRLSNF